MQTIEKYFIYTTEVNRSKFIAYLVPIADYDGLQEKLKQENPKANHVVYALRYLNEYEQIVENFSGGPVGLNTLAAALQEEAGTIEEIFEPYLMQLGFLARTPKGRVVTDKTYKYLEMDNPGESKLF